ncbi:MAG: phosphohistidine phosphatase [Frankiaceae bacterium]|nr:phosphohistidine phosphatase [Frankiaceae bacterium]
MTTRRLVLIRHAKAEAHGGDDAKRRLAPRGERDSHEIGRWLRQAGLTSGVAVVSPARRTVQTWDLAAEELTRAPRTIEDERLYNNTVEDLLAVIQEAPPQARTVILVGHNPSIAALATELHDKTGDRAAAREIATKYPTSGIAVLAVAGPWSALAPGGASLLSFTVPRG